MPTTVTERIDLPRPPQMVLDLMADAHFVARRTALNSRMAERVVRHDVDEAHILIETTSALPADWLPGQVRGAAQVLPTIARVERWDRATGCGTTTFTISGLPGQASSSAEMAVVPRGSHGSRLSYVVTLAVAVPLVGRVIERAMAAQVGSALRAEFALVDTVLSDAPGVDEPGAARPGRQP